MRAWESFIALQEKELGSETAERWLKTLRLVHFDAANLYLEAKDAFHQIWFDEHVRPRLSELLLNNNGRQIKVHLSVPGKDSPTADKKAPRKKKEAEAEVAFQLLFDELDATHTLDAFVVGEANMLPFRIATEVTGYNEKTRRCQKALSNQALFNPIYFYGPKGSGKTHLLMAMAHGLNAIGLHTLYCRAATFTEHVVTAIRAGQMSTFRQAYRHVDVLLIDDVDEFGRKWATQEELFHTFNALHTSGKQIILSGSGAPQELTEIEARLISRFEWGVVAKLEPSSPKQMEEILLKKAQKLQLELSREVTAFLLETFGSNSNTLMMGLNALALRTHLSDGSAQRSATAAGMLLKDLIEEVERQVVTAEKVVSSVAHAYGIPVSDLMGDSHQKEFSLPRHIAMFLCRKRLKMSFKGIGRLFQRDHSTVMSAIKQLQKGLDASNKELEASLNSIEKGL